MARQIVITSRTSTTFSLKVTGLDASYTANDRVYHIFITGGGYTDEDWASYELDGGVTETPVHNLGYFLPNTVYDITVKFFTNTGTYLASVEHTTKTLQTGEEPEEPTPTPTVKIQPWSWEYSNNTASDAQTQLAYETLIHKGSFRNFSHKVWNDICYKAREVAIEQGSGWSDFVDNFLFESNLLMNHTVYYISGKKRKSFTTDKTMTAARFNNLIGGINRTGYTSVLEVQVGDLIKAEYFLTLCDDLNTMIAKINK